jgi:hypothetical protein
MMHTVGKRISGLGEFLKTLRANRKVSHALVLGIAAVAGLAAIFWQAVMIGSDIHAYIDTHGWTAAMERLDEVTAPLWKGKDK